jgi:elongation factor Ts
MAITAQMVKSLREATNAGMMDCKNALQEASEIKSEEKEIMEAAVEILRKKGIAKAAKRLDRETNEGVVNAIKADDVIIMLSVTCETDFVTRNDQFKELVEEILSHAKTIKAEDLESFLNSKYNDQTMSEFLQEKTGSVGEKIEVKDYALVKTDKPVSYYVHSNFKVGAIVEMDNATSTDNILEFGRKVAMHISAMNPVALNKESVPQDLINKELEVIKEQLANEGKPADMIEKISQGKLNRFFKDSCLLEQVLVTSEDGNTVLKEAKNIDANLTITNFTRIAIGV